jgi:hypothetical protein
MRFNGCADKGKHRRSRMEIIEQPDGQSCLLRLSKQEWIELGADYGYLTPEIRQHLVPPVPPAPASLPQPATE